MKNIGMASVSNALSWTTDGIPRADGRAWKVDSMLRCHTLHGVSSPLGLPAPMLTKLCYSQTYPSPIPICHAQSQDEIRSPLAQDFFQ